MHSDIQKISELIAQIRKDRGLSQAEFAKKLGLAKAQLTELSMASKTYHLIQSLELATF